MHQHYRDLAGPVRLKDVETILGPVLDDLRAKDAAPEKGRDLHRVERGFVQLIGEGRGRIGFESFFPSVHPYRARLVGGIDLEPAAEPAAGQPGSRVIEAQQRREWDLGVGAKAIRSWRLGYLGSVGDARGQRCPQSGGEVAVPETFDRQRCRRDKMYEAITAPVEPGGVQAHLQGPEWQLAEARLQA